MWAATVPGMATIRPARPEEAAALTALCIRSKAHWGYDAQFMRQAETALTVSKAMIDAGGGLVAAGQEGILLGGAAAGKGAARGGVGARPKVFRADPRLHR